MKSDRLERRYYDPGVNPQPRRSYGPRHETPYRRKRGRSLFDRARLWAAEEKRQRRRARNLNALLQPGPRWELANG